MGDPDLVGMDGLGQIGPTAQGDTPTGMGTFNTSRCPNSSSKWAETSSEGEIGLWDRHRVGVSCSSPSGGHVSKN